MSRRVAITGAAGQLGRQLIDAFSDAGQEVLALERPDFDITRAADLGRLAAWRPDAVVNAAAWTDVDGCARDPERAMRINGEAAGAVARAAAGAGALIVQISTNEVFDGTLDRPYVEDDEAHPVNAYAISKLVGEQLTALANDRYLIVRTSWLYGGPVSFPEKIREAAAHMMREGRPLSVVADEWGNPTDVRWLAPAVARLVRAAELGSADDRIYHLAGWPPTTRYAWASELLAGVDVTVRAIPGSEYERASRVPSRAILDVSRAQGLGILPGAWRSGART